MVGLERVEGLGQEEKMVPEPLSAPLYPGVSFNLQKAPAR